MKSKPAPRRYRKRRSPRSPANPVELPLASAPPTPAIEAPVPAESLKHPATNSDLIVSVMAYLILAALLATFVVYFCF